jgi:hypothetical protein
MACAVSSARAAVSIRSIKPGTANGADRVRGSYREVGGTGGRVYDRTDDSGEQADTSADPSRGARVMLIDRRNGRLANFHFAVISEYKRDTPVASSSYSIALIEISTEGGIEWAPAALDADMPHERRYRRDRRLRLRVDRRKEDAGHGNRHDKSNSIYNFGESRKH